jgi:hypothetical protein
VNYVSEEITYSPPLFYIPLPQLKTAWSWLFRL